jgi:ATP-dependent DNA helicase
MDKQKMYRYNLPAATNKEAPQSRYSQPASRGRKRRRIDDSDSSDDEDCSSKRIKTESQPAGDESAGPRLRQPALVTGAKLKDYQLEGVEWMISLDQNGISGILGEMTFLRVIRMLFTSYFFQRMRWV